MFGSVTRVLGRGLARKHGVVSINGRSLASIASQMNSAVAENEYKEAVRYTHKNIKWTRKDIQFQTDALANGLLEAACNPGDSIAVWLPECSEKHVTQLAAAKAGLVFADFDLSIDTPEALGDALADSGAKVLIFNSELDAVNCGRVLFDAIAELSGYYNNTGAPFHSSSFPNLKLMIHTGYDSLAGFHNFKHLPVPHPATGGKLGVILPHLKDDTPLYVKYTKDSGGKATKGEVMTHGTALSSKEWSVVKSILDKQYIEF